MREILRPGIPHAVARTNYLDYLDKFFAQLFLLLSVLILSGAGPYPQIIVESEANLFITGLKVLAYPVFIIQAVRGLILLFQVQFFLVSIFVLQVFVVIASIILNGEYFYGVQALIRLVGLSFGMLATMRVLNEEQVIATIIRVLLILLILSVISAIFFPQYGQHGEDSELGALWRGVFSHKNRLGFLAFYVILLCITIPSLMKNYLGWFCIIMALLCFVFSGTSTAVTVSVLAVLAAVGFHLARVLRLPSLPVALVIVIAGIVATIWLEDLIYYVADIFGKSATFTGRTDVWMYSWRLGEQAPLFGNGPSYLEANGAVREALGLLTFRGIGSAHNGYIETFIDTGYLGLVGYLLPYAACLLSWFRRPRMDSQFDNLTITAPICLLVYNFFEAYNTPYDGLGTMTINLLLINRFWVQSASSSLR